MPLATNSSYCLNAVARSPNPACASAPMSLSHPLSRVTISFSAGSRRLPDFSYNSWMAALSPMYCSTLRAPVVLAFRICVSMKLISGSPPGGGVSVAFPVSGSTLLCQNLFLSLITFFPASLRNLSLIGSSTFVFEIVMILSDISFAFVLNFCAPFDIILLKSSALLLARCEMGAMCPSILSNVVSHASEFRCRFF